MWGALGVAPVVVCRAKAIQKHHRQAQGEDADAVGVDVWEQRVAMLRSRVYVVLPCVVIIALSDCRAQQRRAASSTSSLVTYQREQI